MASPTKKIISDRVLYKLAGGTPSPSFPVDQRDIWVSLSDKINAIFKLRQLDTTLPNGETMPENTMIATYEGITVTSMDNGRSKAILPINPISLPKNMGIYLVYDPDQPRNPFIPLQRGEWALLAVDELLNDLNGQIGYEARNTDIIFTKDITLFGVDEVTMELCVFDLSQYGETDPLPLPADYVDSIEAELVKEFSVVVPKTGVDSSYTNQTQVPQNK